MRSLIPLITLLFVTPVSAGGVLIGTIIVTDGGTASNRTTGYKTGTTNCTSTPPTGGGCFALNADQKLTVQTDEGCYVLNDVAGCDAGTCQKLAAFERVPMSILKDRVLTGYAWNWDGGSQATPYPVTYDGGWFSVSPPVGQAACHAYIYYQYDLR